MEIIVTTLIWAAVFQGFLLGFMFIFSKKHRSFSNKLLGLFLITFLFGAISDLIPFEYIGNYDIGDLFATPEVKWLFPVLFLHYVLEKIRRTAHLKKFLVGNYIVAFGLMAITVFNVILFLFFRKSINDLFGEDVVFSFFMAQQYFAFLVTVIALIIAVFETVKYHNIAKNEYSDSTMLAISWLWQFILILVPVIVLWGAELIRIIFGGFGQSDIVTFAWAFIALFIYFVSFKAFIHQDIFDQSKQKIIKKEYFGVKPEEPKTGDEKKVCETIKEAMEKGQFFLNQDLTIHEFAKEINKSPRLISTCINQSFGFNFNEWVNNYRVDKALDIFKDKKNDHLSIEGVGSDSGLYHVQPCTSHLKRKPEKHPVISEPINGLNSISSKNSVLISATSFIPLS